LKKKRVIPVVLFKEGFVVQSKFFSEYRNLGNPYDSIRRFSEWGADEVSFIDIGTRRENKQHRNDLGREVIPTYLEVLEKLSETTNMPLSSGGQIKSLKDISDRLSRGADKVVINTASYTNLDFLKEAIHNFGSQCITVSMDVKLEANDYKIYIENGNKLAPENIDFWLTQFNQIEVGELLLNSIDRDGTKTGFDKKLIDYVSQRVELPLIVCGGAGKWEDFEEVLEIEKVDAAAGANIFQHIDQSVFLAHKYLYNKGVNVRKPQLLR
jgi:cyclase